MTATFETALAFNVIVFSIEIAAFTLLHPYFKVMYEPHTVFLVDNECVTPFKSGLLTWPITLYKADYKSIQRINGPDTYFFVRHFSQQIHFRKHQTEQIYNLETLWLTTKKDLPPSSFCFWFSTCE
ncbi:hypothetical protein J3R82DRAFT_12043 [Butyriboletus roseoflavus]|nr:hypothetical protein J3R82DRAFT_12043 [Butyriboletus roseoflavus]